MKNPFEFFNWLFWLMLLFISQSTLAQCDKGTVMLKSKNRDWVKSFDAIYGKYKSKPVEVSVLRTYFYNGEEKRDCITFAELQRLNELANTNLGKNALSKNDVEVGKFISAISAVAKKNPVISPIEPARNTPKTYNKTEENANDDPHINSSNTTDATNENREVQVESSFWRSIALVVGLLAVLMVSTLCWLLWNERGRNVWLKKEIKRISEKQGQSNVESSDQLVNFRRQTMEQIGRYSNNSDSGKPQEQVVDKLPNDVPPVGISEPKVKHEAELIVAASPVSFFLATPTAPPTGPITFLDLRQNQFISSSSVYKFRLRPDNSSQAEFWFGDSPTLVSSALSYPDSYLAACTYSSLNTSAGKIITDEPGQATLQSDTWQVTRNARIRFV